MVAATGVLDIGEGTIVLVDGAAGTILLEPSADQVEKVKAIAAREHIFDGRGRTADGREVLLLANVGDPKGAAAAAAAAMARAASIRAGFSGSASRSPI